MLFGNFPSTNKDYYYKSDCNHLYNNLRTTLHKKLTKPAFQANSNAVRCPQRSHIRIFEVSKSQTKSGHHCMLLFGYLRQSRVYCTCIHPTEGVSNTPRFGDKWNHRLSSINLLEYKS